MDINIILILAFVVAITVILVNKFFAPTVTNSSNDLDNLTEKYKTALEATLGNLKSSLQSDLSKIDVVNTNVNKLNESFSGSKRFGTKGELILEHAFNNSGLVKGKDWIKNKEYKAGGTTLTVEFGLIHPSKLVLPIDVHFPMTKYNSLIDLRKQDKEKSSDQIKQEEKMLKELAKNFEEKAKEVRKKYVDNPASINFSIIYCPSESLFHELATYVDENKEMLLSKIQKERATLMGPSTFVAFISSILLGFNTFEADKKAKKFMQYWDSLINIVKRHVGHIQDINNSISGLVKASNEFDKAGQKLQVEIDRIKDSIEEMEDKQSGK